MPKISYKGIQMPESPIRKLVPFAEASKRKGNHIFHLNIGQPDIETPKVALDAIKNNNVKILGYSRSEGSESYRKKLCNYYAKHGVNVNSSDIVVTTGGSEALLFTIGAITDLSDEIIIQEPFYANYNGFSIASGVNIVPITSRFENNFSLPNIEEFERLITPRTKAILICNPGNPTGYLYSKEELKKLAYIVKKHDLFIISDEVYREFVYDESVNHHSILNGLGLDDYAIIVDSVSKRYSMCGARIGCLVSKNKEVIQTVLKFAQARLSPPSFAQIASEAVLETPQSYLDEIKKEYKSRRDLLVQLLKKVESVKVACPKGAFYCVVELPVSDAEDFAKWILEDFEDQKQTVMVAPLSGFYSTKGIGKNQIRIAYVLKKEDLVRSVAILEKALKVYRAIKSQ